MNKINKIINKAHYLSKKGFFPNKSGNISIRDKYFIYITQSGSKLSNLKEDKIIYLTPTIEEFQSKRRGREKKPSIETALHIKIYQKTNSNTIIHTHPPYSKTISKTKNELNLNKEEEEVIETKKIPILEKKEPGSIELAKKVSESLKQNKAAIVRNHGIFSRAKNLANAVEVNEVIEEHCKLIYLNNSMI